MSARASAPREERRAGRTRPAAAAAAAAACCSAIRLSPCFSVSGLFGAPLPAAPNETSRLHRMRLYGDQPSRVFGCMRAIEEDRLHLCHG